MPGLETIVRTNQTVEVSPAPLPATAPAVAPSTDTAANIVLTFGMNGSGKTMNASMSFNKTEYQDRKPHELFNQGGEFSIQLPPLTFP